MFHTAEETFTILWCVTSWLLDVANSLSGESHWDASKYLPLKLNWFVWLISYWRETISLYPGYSIPKWPRSPSVALLLDFLTGERLWCCNQYFSTLLWHIWVTSHWRKAVLMHAHMWLQISCHIMGISYWRETISLYWVILNLKWMTSFRDFFKWIAFGVHFNNWKSLLGSIQQEIPFHFTVAIVTCWCSNGFDFWRKQNKEHSSPQFVTCRVYKKLNGINKRNTKFGTKQKLKKIENVVPESSIEFCDFLSWYQQYCWLVAVEAACSCILYFHVYWWINFVFVL